MNRVRFIYNGKPIGKERPRTVRKNGKVWSYTPKKTAEYESKIRASFLESPDFYELPFNPREFAGKLIVNINAYFLIPKSYSDSKKFLLNNQAYTKKPDCDNLAKAILDSLNGVAFKDDSQVYQLNITKRYNEEQEGLEVELLYYE